MASKAGKYKEFDALPFEDALKRLETIVSRMEDGKAPLEELLSRFEEGAYLAQLCQRRLDELQKRIEILVKDSPQSPKWRQFDPDKPGEAEPPEIEPEPVEPEPDAVQAESSSEAEEDARPSAPAKGEDILF